MEIGEPERSGRHRSEDGAAMWLPAGGELDHSPAAPAPPSTPALPPIPALPPQRAYGACVLPAQRARDPLADSDAVGLRKFNIGLVPASATPPGTWKRAAWFAVLSSAAVLVGLALAAAELVGSGGPAERVGLPGYPTDVPLLTGSSSATSPPPATAAPAAAEPGRPDAPWSPDARRRAAGVGVVAEPVDAAPATTEPAAGDPATATAVLAAPTGSPEVTTVPGGAEPPRVDGLVIAARTERFYEEAVRDAGTALAMVSDSFRPGAEALLAQRFADVSLVEVTAIRVDPARGVTLSTLQLTLKDGTRVVEERELGFATTGEPLINAERPAGGAQGSTGNAERHVAP
ncbi:hypothetical protein [Saccharothrix lopnurensis]|uniref:Uncharacterized protein n=1 Tax=Saccharothrix lopnurensis TaxID=1670621 RepID=A0ABW1P234_9PSEU